MTPDELWAGFCDPPDEARPRAWWHWMDGNVDPEGIRLDLEWLAGVGVRGVQMFDGGMGTPLVVPAPVHHGSAEWRDAVRLAVTTAARLGLEFTVATSAGWSAAGAPWVEPADAMKKVVWSETTVVGGGSVGTPLPPLPDTAGPYQDLPRWGADPEARRFAQDWVVLGVPAKGVPEPLVPDRVTGSSPVGEWSCLVDGRFGGVLALPRDPDARSSAWLEQAFDAPVTVASLTVGLPGPRGFGAPPPPLAVLEARDDDEAGWRTVVRVAVLENPAGKAVPVRTVSFPPVTARRFRLVLGGEPAAAGLPRLAEGVQPPPVFHRLEQFLVSQFALFTGARVHEAELKAGFAAAPDYFALDPDPAAAGAAIDPAAVVDLTGAVDADGVLRWDAPPGTWRVLRFGASLTGQVNGPAPAESTGLEVDKLDATTVRRYLGRHLAQFDEALEDAGDARLEGLLSDSIESGPQNWTDRLLERFAELRGYDPLPWLPALAGYVVGDAPRTDRFLFDHRRTLADLLATGYYGTVAAEAHARGLRYYAEALEDHRPQLGDDLAMRSSADVPMGAMWLFDAGTGQPAPTYLADLKGASSVAHVHGKEFTGAESMTAFHRPWSYTPRRLKHVADLELALGVTRFCIHTSPHQPTQVPPPGIGLAPQLGQAFVRSEPWAGMAGPWIDYLARCSWLLNQGTPAVDVAVFVGEEGPVTALFGERPDRTVPAGFDFDYVDLGALETRLQVEDGVLVAGDTRYRVLHLGGSSARMTVRALRRVTELVEAGAVVVGRRPVGSPSLADDDEEHGRLCDALWGAGGTPARVRDDDDPGGALRDLGLAPSVEVEGAELLRIGRRVGGAEVVFLANPLPEPVTGTVRTPSWTSPVLWDPVTLDRRPLSATGRLDLPPLGSVFLVDGGPVTPPTGPVVTALPLDGAWRMTLPGILDTSMAGGPEPWTQLAEGAGFAGVGTYTTEVEVPPSAAGGGRAVLHFGDVGDLARVRVNDVDCGVVWTAPWRVDVTAELRPGRNEVVVEVANAWMNRLIAEAAHPTGEIFAPVAGVYSPDAPRQVAGLTGPVVLVLHG